ncbi:MAG: hypothetical protein HW421_1530 [Ignavibacteria bacterium]|nr:hypothetical protein [Ignavibacteria bacterium]
MKDTPTIFGQIFLTIHTKNALFNAISRTIFVLLIMTLLGQSNKAIAQVATQPASDVTTTAKHYSYAYKTSPSQYKDLEYILVKASNGDIKSCFNACDVCYPYHKGYSQSGTNLRCNNCGKVFDIDQLGSQGAGGCWPGNLLHTLDENNVVIQVSELAKGAYFFLAKTSDVTENRMIPISIDVRNNRELAVRLSASLPKYFRILALDGSLCKDIAITSNEFNLDISDLSSGVYYILTEFDGMPVSMSFYIIK